MKDHDIDTKIPQVLSNTKGGTLRIEKEVTLGGQQSSY